MECPNVESRPEPRRSGAPERFDFALPDFVAEGLAGPDDVAIHLVHRLTLGEPDVLEEEVDALLATPAEVVQSRVHYKAAGSPGLVAQHAVAGLVVRIQSQLVGKALGVERPAFDVSRHVAAEAPEIRQPAGLGGAGDLKVVARQCLVKCQRRHGVARTRWRVEGVDVENAWP